MGPGGWALGAFLCLLWGAAPGQEVPSHIFSEVFFCQPDPPFLGLAQTLDDQPLFWFDFPESSWVPRLTDLQSEVKNRTSRDQILKLADVCKKALDLLTDFSDRYMHLPEAKGVPQLEVFPLRPLELGRPNALVCWVSNLFPPSVSLSWQLDGQPLARGQGRTPAALDPLLGLGFQAFSYLEVTPRRGQVYSCTATSPTDKASAPTVVAFWVPKDPVDPELLANVLCGLAFALGILFTVAGAVLLFLTFRLREAD